MLNSKVAKKSKLYWQCRRGMLELDLLLQVFLDRDYDDLSNQEQVVFQHLLEYQDQMLLNYLLGRSVPLDGAVARVVNKIRRASDA